MNQTAAISPVQEPQKEWFASGVLNATIVERYWRALLRHKWIIAGIFVACLALASVITLLMTPVYTATTRIEISRDQENITNVQGLQSDDADKNLEFYQTQYSLLESKSLAERVARSLDLANDPVFIADYRLGPPDDRANSPSADARFDRVVGILQHEVAIDPIRGSSLVDIAFTSPTPALSAKIANAWAAQFIQSNLDRRFASTKDARDFLEGRLESLREKLEKSEADLVNYASSNRIVPVSTTRSADGQTTTERTVTANDLEALDSALAAATADRIKAGSGLRTHSSADDAIASDSAISALRAQRALVAAQYANLLTTFEPGYPEAAALKSQLNALDQSISH